MKKSEALEMIYDMQNFLPVFERNADECNKIMGLLTMIAKMIAEIDENTPERLALWHGQFAHVTSDPELLEDGTYHVSICTRLKDQDGEYYKGYLFVAMNDLIFIDEL